MRKLTRQDMEDLLEGALILGVGGGGEPEGGKALIEEAFRKKKEFRLIDLKDTNDRGTYCLISYVGGGVSEEEEAMVTRLKKTVSHPLHRAAQELSRYLKTKFSGYYPSEIGAGNTLAAMFVSAMEGTPTVDGDTAGGRAKPETAIATTHAAGLTTYPLAVANAFGEVIYIDRCVDDYRAETITRYLSRTSGGRVGAARCAVQGKELKKGLYGGSISLAIELGKALRTTKGNPVSELIKVLKGRELFLGVVRNYTHEKKQGFYWGTNELGGVDHYEGMTYKVWYKNEHLIAWKNNEVDVTCPDSIIIVDAETGKGLYNNPLDFFPGRKVAVIGRKAGKLWRTKRGLGIFGPGHFGFDFPYKPID